MKPEHFVKLKTKFPGGEYALLDEVRDEAGHAARRSADAIAMGLWPSRGLELQGIEVKSNRGDWLNELKNPAKQESIFKYCDRFWLFATNEKVVLHEAEIPKSWGYLLLNDKDKLVVKKEAPLLKPVPVTKSFLAALLKRATGRMIHPAEIEKKIAAKVEEALQSWKQSKVRQDNEYSNMMSYIAEFEKAAGVRMTDRFWAAENGISLGEAVRVVLENNGKLDYHLRSLQELKKRMIQGAEKIDDLLKPYDIKEETAEEKTSRAKQGLKKFIKSTKK